MPRPLTLDGVLLEAMRLATHGLRVALPARVETYDSDTFTVDVQPLIPDEDEDEDGTRVSVPLARVNGVPVIFPGAGGARMRWPINPGDTVLLIVCSSSIQKWKIRGDHVDAGDDRRHHIADAVAIPGLLDNANAGDASPMIEFTTGSEIHAGGSAKLATKADIDALATYIGAHVHTGGTLLGGFTGAPFTGPPSATGTVILKAALVVAVAVILILLGAG